MIFDKNYRSQKRTKKLLNLIRLPNQGSVLDLSCGDGKLLELINQSYPELKLHGIDISEEEIKKSANKPWGSFQTAPADSLPFQNKAFNTIICSMALHHYTHAEKVLAEIVRVLKDEGTLYLIDILPKNRLSQFFYNMIGCWEPYHFEKFYSKREIKYLGKKSGLSFTQETAVSLMPRTRLIQFHKS